jgi:hypothetical protein
VPVFNSMAPANAALGRCTRRDFLFPYVPTPLDQSIGIMRAAMPATILSRGWLAKSSNSGTVGCSTHTQSESCHAAMRADQDWLHMSNVVANCQIDMRRFWGLLLSAFSESRHGAYALLRERACHLGRLALECVGVVSADVPMGFRSRERGFGCGI